MVKQTVPRQDSIPLVSNQVASDPQALVPCSQTAFWLLKQAPPLAVILGRKQLKDAFASRRSARSAYAVKCSARRSYNNDLPSALPLPETDVTLAGLGTDPTKADVKNYVRAVVQIAGSAIRLPGAALHS